MSEPISLMTLRQAWMDYQISTIVASAAPLERTMLNAFSDILDIAEATLAMEQHSQVYKTMPLAEARRISDERVVAIRTALAKVKP